MCDPTGQTLTYFNQNIGGLNGAERFVIKALLQNINQVELHSTTKNNLPFRV